MEKVESYTIKDVQKLIWFSKKIDKNFLSSEILNSYEKLTDSNHL
jgi:hypothetical protein